MKVLSGFAAYFVAAFLTYGYAYWDGCEQEGYSRGSCSFLAGYLWPIYWGGRLSIDLFEPETPNDQ